LVHFKATIIQNRLTQLIVCGPGSPDSPVVNFTRAVGQINELHTMTFLNFSDLGCWAQRKVMVGTSPSSPVKN
jgi:hypothetical protein